MPLATCTARHSLLLVLLAACGPAVSGGLVSREGASSRSQGESLRIVGAWATAVGPEGQALPCPLIVELFDDGTAELDFVSDDSPEQMCSFVRVPYRDEPDRVPPRLTLAGQLLSCIYRLEGAGLRLACEDRAEPPSDFWSSLLLTRFDPREGAGLADLAGTWSGTRLGPGLGADVVIAPDGRFSIDSVTGRLVLHDGKRLELSSDRGTVEHCIYRVTSRRLTLRCQSGSGPWPEGFAGGVAPPPAVLTRLAPDEDALIRSWRSDPTRHSSAGDRDGDGMRDDVDRCPDEREDHDAFEDADGCPEPDNDRDGVLDADDRCPNVPEDRDGDEDSDGCPEANDVDRDGDGVIDRADRCPDDPEDRDGFEDADGCPDPDNDRDGILDWDDLCPSDPEDRDGHQDQDGCPDS